MTSSSNPSLSPKTFWECVRLSMSHTTHYSALHRPEDGTEPHAGYGFLAGLILLGILLGAFL